MGRQIVTRTVAALLVPCVILSAAGCYSYQAVDLKDAKETEVLFVGTKDGRCFRLTEWTADSLGNITGSGIECSPVEDAKDGRFQRVFKGTLDADSIAFLEAGQANAVGTVALVAGLIGLWAVGAAAFAHGSEPATGLQ